jgi:outer membrane biosynthesis protein TonB
VLVVILIVAPAFMVRKEEPVDQTVLTLVDTEVASESSAQAASQPPAQPTPPEPTPPQPQSEPVVQQAEKVVEKSDDPVPVKQQTPKQPKPAPKERATPVQDPKQQPPKESKPKTTPVKVDLKVHKDNSTPPKENSSIAELNQALKQTAIDFGGTKSSFTPVAGVRGGVTYDNYGSVVKTVYMNQWNPPSDIAPRNSKVSVEVVIRKDGSIRSARIIEKSGSAALDTNIATLINDRVKTIGRPFPAGAKELERTYIIDFNLNLKFNG